MLHNCWLATDHELATFDIWHLISVHLSFQWKNIKHKQLRIDDYYFFCRQIYVSKVINLWFQAKMRWNRDNKNIQCAYIFTRYGLLPYSIFTPVNRNLINRMPRGKQWHYYKEIIRTSLDYSPVSHKIPWTQKSQR